MKLGCGCNQQTRFGRLSAAEPLWTNDPSLILGHWIKPDGLTLVVTAETIEDPEKHFGPGTFRPKGGTTKSDTKPDTFAGMVAFATPFAYEFWAPKKWPRLNWWQNIGAVVGLYFVTRAVYKKVAGPVA